MKNAAVMLAAAAAVMFGLTAPAAAQGAAGTTTMPTFELGAGYQLLRAGEICFDEDEEDCSSSQTFPLGLAIDGIRNFGAFGILGEVGWSYDSEDFVDDFGDSGTDRLNLFHYAGGVRWTGRNNPRVWPYGQVLIGAVTERFSESYDDDALDEEFGFSDTHNHLIIQPGVGVTFVTGDGWGIFGQVDYRRMFLDEDEDGASGRNDIRVFIGARMILD